MNLHPRRCAAAPRGTRGSPLCADTVYQMCYFSWYLVRKNGSPATPVCQIAKLSSHLVQRLSAPRHRIWRPPSDGDVPRNDRPPSKTAFLTETSPFSAGFRHLGRGPHRPPSVKGKNPLLFRAQCTITALRPAVCSAKEIIPQYFRAQSTKMARKLTICSVRGKYTPQYAVHETSHGDE